jgi:hypothetical protein
MVKISMRSYQHRVAFAGGSLCTEGGFATPIPPHFDNHRLIHKIVTDTIVQFLLSGRKHSNASSNEAARS